VGSLTNSGRKSIEHGFVLVTTVILIATTLLIVNAGLLLARGDVTLFRNLRDGTFTYYRTRSALAASAAEVAAGYSFDDVLAGPDAVSGTADDGVAPASDAIPSCSVTSEDDRSDPDADPALDRNRRILLLARCAGPGGSRRALEAVLARDNRPYVPAALYLERPEVDGPGPIVLDGRDHGTHDPPNAPSGPGEPVPAAAAPLIEGPRPLPFNVRTGADGPVTMVAADTGIDGPAFADQVLALGIPILLRLPDGMQLTGPVHMAGSTDVGSPTTGRGMLFVDGDLDVNAPVSFSGVIVVAGGVRVGPSGSLTVRGFLWIRGSEAAPLIDARGPLSVLYSRDAIEAADRLLPLPRQARIRAERELYDIR